MHVYTVTTWYVDVGRDVYIFPFSSPYLEQCVYVGSSYPNGIPLTVCYFSPTTPPFFEFGLKPGTGGFIVFHGTYTCV